MTNQLPLVTGDFFLKSHTPSLLIVITHTPHFVKDELYILPTQCAIIFFILPKINREFITHNWLSHNFMIRSQSIVVGLYNFHILA
jgi:hypothetical protein